jgi:protein-S-isoprenylcysteine O-methyltransferase Ste14
MSIQNDSIFLTDDSPGVTVMPPLIFMSCLLGGLALQLIFPWDMEFFPITTFLVAGGGIAAGGFWFMMWGHNRFKAVGTGVPLDQPATILVTDGAHSLSRNPMYAGFILILAGVGVAAFSVWMALSSVPMFLYLALYAIPQEEKYLLRNFGERYEAYCKSVRRWV